MSFLVDNIFEIILVAVVTVAAYFFITKKDKEEEQVLETTTVTKRTTINNRDDKTISRDNSVGDQSNTSVVVPPQQLAASQSDESPVAKPIVTEQKQPVTLGKSEPKSEIKQPTVAKKIEMPQLSTSTVKREEEVVKKPKKEKKTNQVSEEATGAIGDRLKHRENKTAVETPRLTYAKKTGLVTPRRNRTLKKDDLKKFMEEAEQQLKQAQAIDVPTKDKPLPSSDEPPPVQKKSLAEVLGNRNIPPPMRGLNLASITAAKNKLKTVDQNVTQQQVVDDSDENFTFKNEYDQ